MTTPTIHTCTECGGLTLNKHSTSMCKDCQIILLMNLLDDCQSAAQPALAPDAANDSEEHSQ